MFIPPQLHTGSAHSPTGHAGMAPVLVTLERDSPSTPFGLSFSAATAFALIERVDALSPAEVHRT